MNKRGGQYERFKIPESLEAVYIYIYIGNAKKEKGEYHATTEFW